MHSILMEMALWPQQEAAGTLCPGGQGTVAVAAGCWYTLSWWRRHCGRSRRLLVHSILMEKALCQQQEAAGTLCPCGEGTVSAAGGCWYTLSWWRRHCGHSRGLLVHSILVEKALWPQ